MTPPPPLPADGPGDSPDTARGAAWIDALRAGLLDFFDAHARDLPWRRTEDPYAIWVSEIMLQQTRVETVIPYWERWMARYPSPADLARAPREEVLKSWEGLGYYSRARNLHQAAAVVREEHAGSLPDTVEGLRTLPGVGAYTAGAVASIAFGIPAPAVDGNVRRVAARLLDWPDPAPAQLQKVVGAWVPGPGEDGAGGPGSGPPDPSRGTALRANPAGDFNQALMELGATICTPRNPGCYTCPVAELCAAKAAGTVAQRPAPKKRARVREEERIVEVRVRLDGARGAGGAGDGGVGGGAGRGGAAAAGARDVADPPPTLSFLLRKRPDEGLLAGMYEFPSRVVEEEARREPGGTADGEAGAAGLPGEGSPPRGRPLEPVLHVFTHLRVTYRPVLRVVEGGDGGEVLAPDAAAGLAGDTSAATEPRAGAPAGWHGGDWFPLPEIQALPLPVAQQKILAAALEALEQPELS